MTTKNMKADNIFKYGFFIVVALGILAYVFKGRSAEDNTLIDSLHKEISTLNISIDSLEVAFTQLDKENKVLLDSIVIIESDLIEINEQRVAAIKYYEKRIRNIDNLTTHELDSLFTERYRLSGSDPQEDSN